jgi:hypothetical protein
MRLSAGMFMETTKKLKTTASVFELPQRLGVLQYVEYEPPPKEWCTSEGCLYEGVLVAEGCRKGICIKYRVWVYSNDRRRWEAKERWRRRRGDEDAGGCIRQQVADALWELAGRFEVGLWYEYRRVGVWVNQYDVFCGVEINGVRLDQPHCRTAEECAERILEDYRRELERMKEPPQPALVRADPVEELLKEHPELEAFGVDWLRFWAPHMRERIAEMAKVLRRYPWMAKIIGAIKQTIFISPYVIAAYVSRDGSEACISLGSRGTYCATDGGATVKRLELEFSRLEPHEGGVREVYRPKAKGLLAFAARTKEYVRIL